MIPAGIYGKLTDQYAPTDNMIVTGRLREGQEAWDPVSGKKYRFVASTAAIPVNQYCRWDSASADVDGVKPGGAVIDPIAGVNDTGTAITSLNLFWMLTGGPCTPLVAAGVAKNVILRGSAVAGTFAAADSSAAEDTRCSTRAASGGGGATACYLQGN